MVFAGVSARSTMAARQRGIMRERVPGHMAFVTWKD